MQVWGLGFSVLGATKAELSLLVDSVLTRESTSSALLACVFIPSHHPKARDLPDSCPLRLMLVISVPLLPSGEVEVVEEVDSGDGWL